MAFKVQKVTAFDRDVKSFKDNKSAKEHLSEAFFKILEDPTEGKQMTGNLKGCRSYAYGNKPEYRILYFLFECCNKGETDCDQCRIQNDDDVAVNECEGLVKMIKVGTREEFNNWYKKDFSKYNTDDMLPM